MSELFLVKMGELALKGGNRQFFERKLRANLRHALKPRNPEYDGEPADLLIRNGRLYLEVPDHEVERAQATLSSTFGLVGFSRARRVPKRLEEIRDAAFALCRDFLARSASGTFKIVCRRSDKAFHLSSYEIASRLGDEIRRSFPRLTVDVHNPDLTINVEIREEAFIYGAQGKAPGGLPVGCAGRGVLLLSGGIDSPVAGYLMAKRGLRLSAAYFHAYPFTSDQAKEKVVSLARLLAPWLSGLALDLVAFTPVQLRIREKARKEETTLLMRACMMDIATRIAHRRGAVCLVTGEALSQVASQTVESIRFTESCAGHPVFRPLIGWDKEEIINLARRIGTYETSILPYEDCCSLFAPKRPLIRPHLDRMRRAFRGLDAEELLREAAESAETIEIE